MSPKPQKKKREWTEKVFEDLMAKDFPDSAKDTYLPTELQTLGVNPKKSTPRPITIKFLKTKEKEKIQKVASQKQRLTYKGKIIQMTVVFSSEIMEARGRGTTFFRC